MTDLIKEGDHIMMKRDGCYWVMQVRESRFVYVDKHKFKLDGVIGESYGSKFEVKNDTIYRIDSSTAQKIDLPDVGKGVDNRNIVGKDSNQQLSHEEILAMRKDGLTGDNIVGRLIENSSTFSLKTKYAQDKYIAKKKRKHMPVFTILRPTSRLLIEMYFTKSPGKILQLRPDTLAQILTHANVRAHSNVAVVDTCLGLVLGSVMERLGGFGNVIHVYHGRTPMRPVVSYYDFDPSHMETLHSFPMDKLNLLKRTGNILIDFDKNDTENDSCNKIAKMSFNESPKAKTEVTVASSSSESSNTRTEIINTDEASSTPDIINENNSSKDQTSSAVDKDSKGNEKTPTVKQSPDVVDQHMESTDTTVSTTTDSDHQQPSLQNQETPEDKEELVNGAGKKRFRGTFEDREARREVELKKLAAAQEILTNKKLDCIIVASKFYPTPLVLNLVRYLAPSRQLVVYSQYKEPLMECYAQLRECGGLVNFRMMESWYREYQVLDMRTHPLVNMSGTGGYILVATSITKS